MKKIFYYITDHGKGHATRSIAIIKELQKNFDVIIRNSNAQDMIKHSLPGIKIISGKTDQGSIIKKNGISINKSQTKKEFETWTSELEKNSKKESKLISKYSPDLVISDISYMPLISAKKNNIPSISISNFSWYDVIDSISKKNSKIIFDSYENADFLIKLPFGTNMAHFKNQKKVGLICRKITQNKMQVRKKLGIKESEKIILFALGNSNQKISCHINKNIKLLTMGTPIQNYSTIDVSNWIEGQNIVAASDLVICKCGYGFVTECLAYNVPFYDFYDKNHLEQKSIVNQLQKLGINNNLNFQDLSNFEVSLDEVNIKKSSNKIKIDTNSIIKIISEFVSK
jgi:uncharacterized protein (TIGR00661 family)